jgi:alkylated DNA repair protein (DNA oxidative demethylase)
LLEQPGRVVLLLDGLDEVFDVNTCGTVVNDIHRFAGQFAGVPVVLTSHVVGYQAQPLREAGFQHFVPNACLINRYETGARLSLHQDRDEQDFSQPIVSVSLGLPAVFLFGGLARGDPTARVPLHHGDVVVWGGPSRLRYHGVLALKGGTHAMTGACRVNLTFRYALVSGSRTGQLLINGVAQNITFNSTGSWTTWQTQNVTVTLTAGTTNTIRLQTNGQDLANVDQLVVTAP